LVYGESRLGKRDIALERQIVVSVFEGLICEISE
jgi:hypothetical protein